MLPEQAIRAALEGGIVDHMRNTAANKLRDVDLAEELAHDVVVAALNGAAQVRDASLAKEWIWAIFNNLIRSNSITEIMKRRSRQADETELRTLPSDIAIERNLDRAIEMQRMRRVMHELPQRDQQILTLAFVDGLQRAEICRQLALTATQERLRKSRAKARLRDLYQAEIQQHRHGLAR
jgi:RNA polymerase sigma-70 factor (ECF subfamily)